MKILETWALGYLLNSLWQVPLVFAAAWSAARLVRRAGPALEHRVWVSALLLATALPACRFNLNALAQQAWHLLSSLWSGAATQGHVRVTIGAGTAAATGWLKLPTVAIRTLLAIYALSLLFFAARLLWRIWRTNSLISQAEPLTLTGELRHTWRRLSFGLVDRISAAEIAVSPRISGPVTVGGHRFALLLPPDFLDQVSSHDLDAVFAHELAHMRRNDFAKNLLYEALSLPIAWHPLLWLMRSRLTETREMVCDRMAADSEGQESYARSLLRLASMLANCKPAGTLHAIGIFDANIFERRIMNLTQLKPEIRLTRKLVTLAACGLIAVATCGSALALRLNVETPVAQDAGQIQVSAGVMAGQIVLKTQPVYPPEAKADPIDGQVILHAIIGKDGSVEHLTILQSLRGDYDRSALDAVKDWKYKPYLLNGNPTEVETTITVNYSTDHSTNGTR
jgi:TonB family protein